MILVNEHAHLITKKDELLNILILKQVEGPKGTIFTLNRNDCKRYHIKYEPGLQVFSMEFNWIPCNATIIIIY